MRTANWWEDISRLLQSRSTLDQQGFVLTFVCSWEVTKLIVISRQFEYPLWASHHHFRGTVSSKLGSPILFRPTFKRPRKGNRGTSNAPILSESEENWLRTKPGAFLFDSYPWQELLFFSKCCLLYHYRTTIRNSPRQGSLICVSLH